MCNGRPLMRSGIFTCLKTGSISDKQEPDVSFNQRAQTLIMNLLFGAAQRGHFQSGGRNSKGPSEPSYS